jgi:hypothetical protein
MVGRANFFYARPCCHCGEMLPKLAVIVAYQVLGTLAPRRGFPQLLRYPGIAGMGSHGNIHDTATGMFDDHKDEKRTEKRYRRLG